MASAEVRISGYGRFGLDYNDSNSRTGTPGFGGRTGVSETNITSRLRLQFDMTSETDAGVTLGARFRAQAESRDGTPRDAVFNGARFFANVGGFTLGVGNINGGFESMPGMYLPTRAVGTGIDGMGFHSHVGNVDRAFFNWDSYESDGPGRNGIEVIFSNAGFTGHLSYSRQNDTVSTPGVERLAGHISYTFGDWTAALGIQDSNVVGEDKTAFSVTGDFGNFGVGLAYADNQDASGPGNDVGKFRLYGDYDIGAASTILLWITSADNPNTPVDGESYGAHYSYDLGGGASFEAGIVRTSASVNQVQAGVYFSF